MSSLYQVVSEHSILSAQREIKYAAMEFIKEESMHCVPEWKERFEEIERHWKKRRKPEEKRCRARRHHAPTRRSGRRDKILKKMEEILVDLRSSISDLREKLEGEKENGETGSETLAVVEPIKGGEGDELEKRNSGSRSKSTMGDLICADAKTGRCGEEEESENNDDSVGRGRVVQKRNSEDEGRPPEEPPLEPDWGETVTEVHQFRDRTTAERVAGGGVRRRSNHGRRVAG